MAVRQDPVLLLGVEEKAQDVKVEPVLLVRGPLIGADQQAALHLRVRQQHNLRDNTSERLSRLESLNIEN